MPSTNTGTDIGPNGHDWNGSWKFKLPIEGYILESWSQGFMVGALVIMSGLTISNMTSILLHKLILVELLLAVFHGTFCFANFKGFNWYLSATAITLYSSWYLHNIIAWMKTKPFLRREYSMIYIFSFLLVTPYWILETYGNFAFFNNIDPLFQRTRPFEALCRDPWWIFTCVNLIYNIKKKYNMSLKTLIRTSPRFGIMLVSMAISIVFLIVDVLSTVIRFGAVVGINPYWKLSLVFKCFCDTIILDDFRSALEKIRAAYFTKLDGHRQGSDLEDHPSSWTASTGGRRRSLSHRMGHQVNIKSVPKRYTDPKAEHERKSAFGKGSGGNMGTIFGGRHQRLGSEDADKIYVSTDVVTNRECQDQSDDGRRDSAAAQQQKADEW